jgi:hypothetical protein
VGVDEFYQVAFEFFMAVMGASFDGGFLEGSVIRSTWPLVQRHLILMRCRLMP